MKQFTFLAALFFVFAAGCSSKPEVDPMTAPNPNAPDPATAPVNVPTDRMGNVPTPKAPTQMQQGGSRDRMGNPTGG